MDNNVQNCNGHTACTASVLGSTHIQYQWVAITNIIKWNNGSVSRKKLSS